jgi:hypothetical protein
MKKYGLYQFNSNDETINNLYSDYLFVEEFCSEIKKLISFLIDDGIIVKNNTRYHLSTHKKHGYFGELRASFFIVKNYFSTPILNYYNIYRTIELIEKYNVPNDKNFNIFSTQRVLKKCMKLHLKSKCNFIKYI